MISETIPLHKNEVRKETIVWKDSVASMKMLLGINGAIHICAISSKFSMHASLVYAAV
jgi:hypothetical protein